MPHHDLIVIGTGSGKSVITPAIADLDIAIIDEDKFGGTCLNVGCIPTKMLVIPADRVVEAREAEALGVRFGEPEVDWPSIRDRVFGRVDPIAEHHEHDYRERVTVYAETARFVGEKRLRLDSGTELTADRIVVAAGSRPKFLPIPGLDRLDVDAGIHSSDTVMRLDELPPRMAIVGGGFIACEFAHVFDAYGVEVTMIEFAERLLPVEETAVGDRFTEVMRRRMPVHVSSEVTSAERRDGVWHLTASGPDGEIEVAAEVVLVAVGRVPNGDRLDAATGGLATDDAGRIVVDAQQRTSVPGVWALGDVSSEWPLKHVANHEGRTAAHNVALDLGRADGEPRESDHRFVPHAVFTHPQVAAFGPTSAELDEAGTRYVSATHPYSGVAYGWALEDTDGFLTIHADPASGKLLAAHCIGPQAATLIQPLIQAAHFGQRADEIARAQYWIHPALTEVVENALLNLELD